MSCSTNADENESFLSGFPFFLLLQLFHWFQNEKPVHQGDSDAVFPEDALIIWLNPGNEPFSFTLVGQ